MVHIAESTVGRRYAGWFIRNTEYAQRVLDTLRGLPLPVSTKLAAPPAEGAKEGTGGQKVAWGSTKAA